MSDNCDRRTGRCEGQGVASTSKTDRTGKTARAIQAPSLNATKLCERHAAATRDLRGVVLDGRYVLEARLDSGNTGSFWRAKDQKVPHLGRMTMIKILPTVFASKAYAAVHHCQAHLTEAIDRDYFPLLINVGVNDGFAWLALVFAPGIDLGSYLESNFPNGMDSKDAVPVLMRLLEGLAAAHARGAIHGSIEPGNILVDHAEGQVRILDFGVAKAQHEVFAPFSRISLHGTQRYCPPESHWPILRAEKASSDMFAVGLIAYRMILGRHPLASCRDHVARYKRGEALVGLHSCVAGDRAGVDAALSAVFSKAVSFDPAKRYQNASEMLNALELATANMPGEPCRRRQCGR